MMSYGNLYSVLWALVLAELVVCGGALNRLRAKGAERFFAYDYSSHGQDWSMGSCQSRSRQSPIDLPTSGTSAGTFSFNYEQITSSFLLLNNGHVYSADLAGMGYGGITYDDVWYNLLNINVHAKSEHTWNGAHEPLELHLVHKRWDGEELLIVAVPVSCASPPAFFQEESTRHHVTASKAAALLHQRANASQSGGKQPLQHILPTAPQPGASAAQATPTVAPTQPLSAPSTTAGTSVQVATGTYTPPVSSEANHNPSVQAFLKVEPPSANMKVSVPMDTAEPMNLASFFQGATFFEYYGSLTAPPCAETATWLVRTVPIMASDTQVLYLHDGIYQMTAEFGNFRSVMPINGRQVTERQAVMEDKAPVAPPSVPDIQPQQSDREFRAMKWAKDALTIAKGATDYVKDLDMRLRNAAQAHAQALQPQLGGTNTNTNQASIGGFGGASLDASKPVGGNMSMSMQQMEQTAETMTRTIALAAREAVQEASAEIAQQAHDTAMKAAHEAAEMVMYGPIRPQPKLSSAPNLTQSLQNMINGQMPQGQVPQGQVPQGQTMTLPR